MQEHYCNLKRQEESPTFSQKLKIKIHSLLLVSEKNPLHLNFFKSEFSIKEEQSRQLQTNPYVIHPYSQFRGAYEIYLVILYINALLAKPMGPFMRKTQYFTLPGFMEYSIILDLLCCGDIVITFLTGYTKRTNKSQDIELGYKQIAKQYIFGPYFICDVLSSIPKGILNITVLREESYSSDVASAIIDFLMFLKIIRIVTLFTYIYKSAQYLKIKSKVMPFLICILLLSVMIVHWAACLQFSIPLISVYLLERRFQHSWIFREKIDTKRVRIQYCHSFFKGSAYILGINLPLYKIELAEEYVLAIATYVIGKFFVVFIWLILAMAILSARSVDIKFLEIMNQLDEYMMRKKLPLPLKERIAEYYRFKYQKKYFKEALINNSLPENITKQVKMHVCKSMIKNVLLFADLTYAEVTAVVEYMIPEIFLPNDTIIQHGTYGDAMYFLSTGTVAVYSRSGKEICHLQDGSHFGEISLLLPNQTRNASIVAIEISQVYRLNKKDFERCILKNKNVYDKVMKCAEDRLKEAADIEDEYKKLLFEQAFQAIGFNLKPK